VKIKGQEMRISALFNRNAPNTLIGYGAAAILGLKGGQARRLVTTEEGSPRMSYAWYDVPLQGEDGRVWQIRASGVLRTARVKNEGKNGEVTCRTIGVLWIQIRMFLSLLDPDPALVRGTDPDPDTDPAPDPDPSIITQKSKYGAHKHFLTEQKRSRG
jgi:hypothetical protein